MFLVVQDALDPSFCGSDLEQNYKSQLKLFQAVWNFSDWGCNKEFYKDDNQESHFVDKYIVVKVNTWISI